MTQPKVLMLDEPTAGVSPIVMDELFDRIIEVARTGLPVLMVEQNARQALEIADRGYVLVQGANGHTGTGQELLADPEVRASFLGGMTMRRFLCLFVLCCGGAATQAAAFPCTFTTECYEAEACQTAAYEVEVDIGGSRL